MSPIMSRLLTCPVFMQIFLLVHGNLISTDPPNSVISVSELNQPLHVCDNITASVKNCKNDFFGSMHSPCNPSHYTGDSVTMWQLFSITLPKCNTTEVSPCGLVLTAEWSRNHAFSGHAENITSTVKMEDNEYTVLVNASLTLYNISIQPDHDPDYKVVLSVSNCSGLSLEGFFGLLVKPRCNLDFPAPIQKYLTVNVAAGAAKCPRIETTFIGGTQNSGYFEWVAKANNKTICFSISSNNIERYACGREVNNEITCNYTVWLMIKNCSSSDAGNYTVRPRSGDTIGDSANVLLSFQQSDEDMAAFNTAYKALSVSSAGILILLIVVAVVVIAMIVIRRRSRSPTIHTDTTTRPSPPDVTTFHVNTCTDSVRTAAVVGHSTTLSTTNTTICSGQVVWKSTNSSKQLRPEDLLPISKAISHWKELARHLGLSKPDIVAIEHNHLHDYEEQKYQMLRKWFEQNSTPPSRQSLIKIIEEKMKDQEMAGEVASALYRLDMEEGEKVRSRSCRT